MKSTTKEHPRCEHCGDKHSPDQYTVGWFIIPPEKDGENPTIRQVKGEGEIFKLIRSGELGPASHVFWNLNSLVSALNSTYAMDATVSDFA